MLFATKRIRMDMQNAGKTLAAGDNLENLLPVTVFLLFQQFQFLNKKYIFEC